VQNIESIRLTAYHCAIPYGR